LYKEHFCRTDCGQSCKSSGKKNEIIDGNTSTAQIMGESLLQESLLQVLHSDGILSCHSQTIPHNSLVHVEFSTVVRF
jgi:hypothetical protein